MFEIWIADQYLLLFLLVVAEGQSSGKERKGTMELGTILSNSRGRQVLKVTVLGGWWLCPDSYQGIQQSKLSRSIKFAAIP